MTCSLPPYHQSDLALVLEIELVLALDIVLDIEHYHITTSVSPLPPHQSVI